MLIVGGPPPCPAWQGHLERLCLWPQPRGALLSSAIAGVTAFMPETSCWFIVQMEMLLRVRGTPTQLCCVSLSWAAGKCGRPVCSLVAGLGGTAASGTAPGLAWGGTEDALPLVSCALPCDKCYEGSVSFHTPGCLTSLVLVVLVSPSSPRACVSGLGDSWTPRSVLSPRLVQTL